jgi:hypothetical protein
LVLGWRTKDLATEEDAHRVAAELILQFNAHNPRPVDGPRRGLAATPGDDLIAAHPKQLGNPGYSPGRRHPRRDAWLLPRRPSSGTPSTLPLPPPATSPRSVERDRGARYADVSASAHPD